MMSAGSLRAQRVTSVFHSVYRRGSLRLRRNGALMTKHTFPFNGVALFLALIAVALLVLVDASNPAMVIAFWLCAVGAFILFMTGRAERRHTR
jgi:hypothetical protein